MGIQLVVRLDGQQDARGGGGGPSAAGGLGQDLVQFLEQFLFLHHGPVEAKPGVRSRRSQFPWIDDGDPLDRSRAFPVFHRPKAHIESHGQAEGDGGAVQLVGDIPDHGAHGPGIAGTAALRQGENIGRHGLD